MSELLMFIYFFLMVIGIAGFLVFVGFLIILIIAKLIELFLDWIEL